MSSFDNELTDLFPSENFAKMGNSRVLSNDDFTDIFKQVEPLSAIDTDNVTGGEDNGLFTLNESEIQTQGIFELLGDSCFQEPSNYCSLLNFDSDDLLLNDESALETNQEVQTKDVSSNSGENGSESDRNQDSCIDKIVDILATFVNESSQGELNFNNDILDHSKECSPSEAGEKRLLDKVPNSTGEDILMKTISLSNLETEIDAYTSDKISNDLHFETDESAVCQVVVSKRKLPDRPLLPRLTEFGCDVCHPKMFFLSKVDFLKHQQNHKTQTSKKQYECKNCNRTFSESKIYLNHMRNHQKQKCKICLKEFSASSFKNHLALHDKSLRLICEHCGLDFVSKMKLEEHISLHTNQKLYVCELCNRTFSNHGSFWLHKKWHKSPLPYKCDCGLLFRHSSVLANHRRKSNCAKILNATNSTLPSSECLSNANSPSTNSSSSVENDNHNLSNDNGANTDSKNLKVVVSKLPKKIHLCEICDRNFPTTTSLAVHRLKHTKERHFKCERCWKTFPVQNSLMKHRKSIVACDRQLKKRLQQEVPTRAPMVQISPKLDANKLHCPYCNVNFPNLGSLAVHFCDKTKSQKCIEKLVRIECM